MLSFAHLPPTKSHGNRLAAYFEPTRTLLVRETSGVRVVRTRVDRYRVEEEPAVGFMGRAFLVLRDDRKTTKAPDTQADAAAKGRNGNTYCCHVYADGFSRCSCDAGAVKRSPCVHGLALGQLIADGSL